MKVNIISTFNRNCGIGQYTEQLGLALNQRGSEVKVFRKDDPDQETFHSYPYRSFRSWQHRVAPFFLKEGIRNEDTDLWHADYVSSFQAVDLLRTSQPAIVTVHDAIPFHFPGKSLDFQLYKYQMRKAIKKAKYLVTVSETARKDLIQQTGVSPAKVKSIHNGIKLSEFEGMGKSGDHERFIIRYLGGLGAPHKNVPLLLEMAKMLEQKGIDFSLELGGYLPEKHPLKDKVKQLGLTRVSFPGFIPDDEKVSFLAGADLFVFPSLIEGFGFPPMEAMAAGTAVLASDIPVFQELIGSSSKLAIPTANAFAEAVMQLIHSETCLAELAQAGREHVRKYSWDKVADQTAELYQLAMNS